MTADVLEQLRLAREALTAAVELLDVASSTVAREPVRHETAVPRTVTPREFAAMTSIPRDRVYALLRSGRLRAIRFGTRWRIPVWEAARLLRDLQNGEP